VEDDAGTYGGIKQPHKAEEKITRLLGELACQIEDIIRRHAVVRWHENTDAQNRMRNDLDDLLFTLQSEQGVKLTYAQMDSIIESILRIARNRSDVRPTFD
jgi:type I restriction enzyme R subunit